MNDATSILSLALQAVSDRILVLLALVMSFGLFCWALWAGTGMALVAAVTFAGVTFLPLLWRGSRGKDG